MFGLLHASGLPLVYVLEYYVGLAIGAVVICVSAYALVQSVLYSGQAYTAADKLTKPLWIGILFFALLFQVISNTATHSPVSFFSLAFMVATLVFLVDVKPAVAEMQGGR